ncbi:MAG: putative transposase [Brevibacillus sp.]|nr:putative transposase [Brevibacillus sp.]
MAKKNHPTFILECPLRVEYWKADLLEKRFEIGRKLYNAVLAKALGRYKAYLRDHRVHYWIAQKPSPERNEMLTSLRMEHKLSEYHLHGYVGPMQRIYASFLDANTSQKIATRVWKAISDLLFRKSNDVHFKKHGEMDSLEGKTNKQGIRFRDGAIHWNHLILPVVIKPKDTYAHEALSGKVKYCRLLRKWVRGKVKYYVQFVIDGFPPQKKKHHRQEGKVGIDIGISTIAVVSDTSVSFQEFCPGLDDKQREKRLLQRKMDRSKRATNPHKFNEDGTAKKKDGTRWMFSKRYQELRVQLREIHRRMAAKRKIEHEKLANLVLAHGNEVKVEEMNYRALAKRKRGYRFGRQIAKKAPSLFLTILNRKLGYQKKELIKVNTRTVRASQYDPFDDQYRKKPLSERWHDTGIGIRIQRDIFSAWLIKNVKVNHRQVDRQACLSEFPVFYGLYKEIELQLKIQRPFVACMDL